MTTTVFTNTVTLTDADWFNDGNRVIYDLLDDAATKAAARTALAVVGTAGGTMTGDLTLKNGNIATGIKLATEQASTSGTSIDFTGIPAGTKRITVMFTGVSTNGNLTNLLIQLGDSGGFETSGYLSDLTGVTTTSGFLVKPPNSAADQISGAVILSLQSSSGFRWVASGSTRSQANSANAVNGSKALTAELDRVRITNENGTDTFDAGAINISYE